MRKLPGQSIVETTIAAGLIMVCFVAALSLLNYTIKQNTYARQLSVANKYAYQAADWLRAEKSLLGWTDFTAKLVTDAAGSNTVSYCLITLPAPTIAAFTTLAKGACSSTNYITGTTITRELTLNLASRASGIISGVITTSWQANDTRTTSLELELTQWN